MNRVITLVGIFLLLGGMYLFSLSRNKIKFPIIIKGMIIQFIIALILVKIPLGRFVISKISDVITVALSYGKEGIKFVFGSLAVSSSPTGSIFAIQILGNIVFTSALFGVLYYIGVLGFIIKAIGRVVGKILGTSKVESFIAVANMFLGHTDSPILISKYLGMMTKSEIMVVLVSGMGSMSANIMIGYVAMGISMEYLLIASALVPFGSIIVSKILYPETEEIIEIDSINMDNKGSSENLIDALTEGASVGMRCAFAIGSSLIAIMGIVALINGVLGFVGGFIGLDNLNLNMIFSYIFSPLGFIMGVSKENIFLVGQLLGTKLTLNEFIAFRELGSILKELDYRTGIILTISLAGFANISSMGMCVAAISSLCPEKRGILSRLIFRAMIGGFIVSLLNSLIVGFII